MFTRRGRPRRRRPAEGCSRRSRRNQHALMGRITGPSVNRRHALGGASGPAPACGGRPRQAGEVPEYGAPERVDELQRRTGDEDTAARSAAWNGPRAGPGTPGARPSTVGSAAARGGSGRSTWPPYNAMDRWNTAHFEATAGIWLRDRPRLKPRFRRQAENRDDGLARAPAVSDH